MSNKSVHSVITNFDEVIDGFRACNILSIEPACNLDFMGYKTNHNSSLEKYEILAEYEDNGEQVNFIAIDDGFGSLLAFESDEDMEYEMGNFGF